MIHDVPVSATLFLLLGMVLFSNAFIAPFDSRKLIPSSQGPPDTVYSRPVNPEMQRLYLAETTQRTYYVTVGIGTPQQYLRLLMHTGMADMWIRECTSYCSRDYVTRASYNPAHSSTVKLKRVLRKYRMLIYPRTVIVGNLERDYVLMGTKFVSDQSFCAYDEVYFSHSAPTSFTPLDGFLGLGPPEGSIIPGKPFFVNLIERAVVPQPQISIFLHDSFGGELILGGTDPKHNISAHKWVHITNERGSWTMQLEDINMFKIVRTCDSWCRATINTGFSHIAGPPEVIQKINKFLTSFEVEKVRNRDQSCQERIHDFAQEFINHHHNRSNQQMCLASSLCETKHFAYMSNWKVQELLNRNVSDYLHDFGCAVCMAVAESIKETGYYDSEIGTALCNWIDHLDYNPLEMHDTEEVDCSSIRNMKLLRFRINDHFLFVDSNQYIYKRVHKTLLITCHTEFVEYKQSSGSEWILGTAFLRAFHTVIDFGHNLVGFAKPARL